MIAVAVSVILAVLFSAATLLGYVNPDAGTFLAFASVLAALILKDKHKVKREGILLIRRTLRGREFIDRIQKKHTMTWSAAAKIGVAVGILFMIIGAVFMASQTVKILDGSKEGGVRLILPGPVSQPNADVPGVFLFPWWIWVIGIAAVIIPHEFMHGIMCRLEGIRIKSVGWILLLIIPGAFVEPDEKQLQKAKRSTKLKVYAAGSFANIAIAFLILAVFASVFALSFQPSGLAVQTVDGGPANLSGFYGAITSIDGREIRNMDDLSNALSAYSPGDTVSVKAVDFNHIAPKFGLDISPQPVAIAEGTEREYSIVLSEKNDTKKSYMGVVPRMEAYSTAMPAAGYSFVSMIFMYIYLFSLGIGIVNLLPLKPLDGGLIFEEIVGRFTGRHKKIVAFMSSLMLLLLIFNLVGPVIMG